VPWEELLPVVCDAFESTGGRKPRVVQFEEWLKELKKCPLTEDNVKGMPALKLLDTFEGQMETNLKLALLDTSYTQQKSETMRRIRPIDQSMLWNWLKQWKLV